MKVFADLELARRLEPAEGSACRGFAEARARLDPSSGAAWIECAGAWAVFDGVDSPVTQSFGLGIFEEPTSESMDRIERFFLDREVAVMHEVCPLAGIVTLDLLCARGYRPLEVSSVLYQPVMGAVESSPDGDAAIHVRAIAPDEAALWASIHARGWAYDHPEYRDFLEDFGMLSAGREQSVCFLAELNGEPGAAGVLCLYGGVALFGGAATIPEMRRRGLQAALLQGRMRYAREHGCDLAMMVAEAGSQSQRNAERTGFRIAYTRTKWKLTHRG
ncbi:MAG: GNAT family N-acetyltransferase [Acidobacteriaceae bacterium]|nr:GNAT family N-acetyltransferase [Acidobacteriaceae bacterium]